MVGPMHEMYGTLDAEFEVQRTIKTSQKGCRPYMAPVDDKESLSFGEEK